MKLPSISQWTALVVVAGIAGVCLMVYLKVSLETFGLYSAAMIAFAGALAKLFPGGGPPGSGLPGATASLVVLAMALSLTGCPRAFAATELLARKVQCALANRDLSNEQLLLKCAIDPADAKNILEIVGDEREHDAALRKAGCPAP